MHAGRMASRSRDGSLFLGIGRRVGPIVAWPPEPPVWHLKQGIAGPFALTGPITVQATAVGFAGLAADYTPANPPAAGTVLPARPTNLKMVTYGIVALNKA